MTHKAPFHSMGTRVTHINIGAVVIITRPEYRAHTNSPLNVWEHRDTPVIVSQYAQYLFRVKSLKT